MVRAHTRARNEYRQRRPSPRISCGDSWLISPGGRCAILLGDGPPPLDQTVEEGSTQRIRWAEEYGGDAHRTAQTQGHTTN